MSATRDCRACEERRAMVEPEESQEWGSEDDYDGEEEGEEE